MFNCRVKKRKGDEDVIAFELSDRDNIYLPSAPDWFIGSQNKKKPKLFRYPIFLDTETSHNHDKENPKGGFINSHSNLVNRILRVEPRRICWNG